MANCGIESIGRRNQFGQSSNLHLLVLVRLKRIRVDQSDISFMQHHKQSMKQSFKMSIESRNSVASSCRSLERPSWSSRPHSLSKNHSMLEVMSLESNRKSDIYDKLISVENQPTLSRQSMGGMIDTNNQYTYPQQVYEEVPKLSQRKSEDEGCVINHTCICYSDCQWAKCPCMQSKDELCVAEYCCSQCIANKNALLRGYLQQYEEQVSCTCKKTKCNKKYCSCFAAGVLCGEKCSCQGCINCPQQPSNQMEIEQQDANYIPEDVLAQMPMPQNMDFQPVEFRFSNNN